MKKGGSKPPSQRQLRVGEEVRHVIASLLERGDIRDPDVSGRVITVTEVSVSPDLKNASVYVQPLGGGDVKSVLTGLMRARAFVRRALAQRLRLRMVPEVTFLADSSFDYAQHIESLLGSPEVARDLKQADDDGA